jgi:hypothetical protein
MASRKVPQSEPVSPGKRPAPGPLPTDGEGPREVFRRGDADLRSHRKDTDEEGWSSQRKQAPPPSPLRRSDKTDGGDDR